MILCSPFSCTFGQRKIFIGNNLLDAGRYQVRAHIGKIGISTIVIFQIISCVFQAAGDRRKFVCFFGIFQGILQFDAGEITIGGHSIKTEPLACKQLLAYIPDNPDLYDFMSGIQYLNFIADIFGIPAAERWARIEPYADAFELTGDLGQPISAYSHGMKQKLAIIAAWIHDPKLVIMDEPFVGLDPKAAHLLKGMMRELCDAGGAIFFSTHVLEVAEKLCDKVAIIKGGRLIRSGTMEEVKGDDSLEDVFLELEDASC